MSIVDLDLIILKFINQPFLPYINFLAIFINYSIYIFLLYLAYFLLRKREKNTLTHLIVVTVIGYFVVTILKILIARPRPYLENNEILGLFEKSDYSFPSAHTFISLIGYYFVNKTMSGFTKKIFSIYLLFLIPIGLMYIGVHYPTDVISGALIGILLPRVLSEKFTTEFFKNIFTHILSLHLFKPRTIKWFYKQEPQNYTNNYG